MPRESVRESGWASLLLSERYRHTLALFAAVDSILLCVVRSIYNRRVTHRLHVCVCVYVCMCVVGCWRTFMMAQDKSYSTQTAFLEVFALP